jgi:mRNA interferase HigB
VVRERTGPHGTAMIYRTGTRRRLTRRVFRFRHRLLEYTKIHPLARPSLERWRQIAKAAEWKNFNEVKQSWKSADVAKTDRGRTVVVFNLGGNNFRLVTAIHYNAQKVFILRFYPQHEYSKDDWKREL